MQTLDEPRFETPYRCRNCKPAERRVPCANAHMDTNLYERLVVRKGGRDE